MGYGSNKVTFTSSTVKYTNGFETPSVSGPYNGGTGLGLAGNWNFNGSSTGNPVTLNAISNGAWTVGLSYGSAGASTANLILVPTNGNVGIGTTTPFAKLSIYGHLSTGTSTAPTLTSCGTNPSITGTDNASTITEGTIATSCTMTFNTPFRNTPVCTITSQSGLVFSYTKTNTAITITNVGALSSTLLDVVCVGQNE
jgi:hypothetical protein